MALAPGTRLGPYEILAPVGAGAMGVVYRARDTRLGRDVAVKVLPPAFARDPDRLARFEREARAVAAINHPNILAVHDIGSAEVTDSEQGVLRATYMVTELLDGETLRTRLAQGVLPARKCADVAMQAARGLAAAHARGIVHRDLKPENIVLLRDGHVKILDFGLAKQSTATQPGSGDLETQAATDAGTVLGTVGYMAPEQVRGETADARTDLFALGAVLHELATGKRAFERTTPAETMAAILRDDPPEFTTTPPALASGLARIVRHALEKDPGHRFQSAQDFAFALQAINDSPGSGAEQAVREAIGRPPTRTREVLAWALAGALAAVAIALWVSSLATPGTTPSTVIFAPALPWRDATLISPAVSPDGRRVAFIARGAAVDTVVVRALDSIEAQPVAGTNGVRRGGMFWSPDGRSLGFFAAGKLKTVELASGRIDEISPAPSGYGGAWAPDGTILFCPDERAPLFRVAAQGGKPVAVTSLEGGPGDQSHRWPKFMPDGRHFVYMAWTSDTLTRTIRLGSLDGAPPVTLFESKAAPIVAGTHLIYVQEQPSRLMAQAFNPKTFALEGRPAAVVADDNADFIWFTGDSMVSAGGNTLVYTTGKFRQGQLTWFDRSGRHSGAVGDPDIYYDPAISPDGSTLAVEKRDAERNPTDLWTVDLARGAFSRLTTSPGFENTATWSPDGRRIAFSSDQPDGLSIRVKNSSGTGAEEVLVTGRGSPSAWSSDGRYLLFTKDGGASRADIWVYDFLRSVSAALVDSPYNEARAKFSPDGKWIVYASDDGSGAQVYVRSFPDGASKLQISAAGGDQPEWRGTEIFYLAPDGKLMAVTVRPSGATLTVSPAQALFQTGVEQGRLLRNNYTASSDGQRFLVLSPVVNPATSPLVGVLNWAAGLRSR
jgi:Tol biopolymer transport system component